MKKKILILSLSYYPKYVGGAEVAIREITDRLPDVEFHMVTLRFDTSLPEVEQIGNVLVYRIGIARNNPMLEDLKKWPLHVNKYLYQIMAYVKAHKLHLQHSYDGLWAMMAHATGAPMALFNFSHPKIPFVLTLQEGDDLAHVEQLARPVWPLFKRAFTRATVVQTISTYLAQWARRMGSECPVFVIPNGVDVALFEKKPEEDALIEVRKKCGMREGDILLITTSRLVKKNAIDDVLRALSELPEHVRFLVVGDGPERQNLLDLACECGVGSRVTFVGTVRYTEIPLYLHASDVFIRPSRTEGMGNSFIEAMAVGIPVIATQEGGLRDFIFGTVQNPDKPTTAWVVPKDDSRAIAQAVLRILDEPHAVLKVVKNAKEYIKGTYEWNTVAERMDREIFSMFSKKI